MLEVINDQGRKFLVVILRQGDRYGLNNCLQHEDEKPAVEFYDATYVGETGFGHMGQFVSRYFVETILEDATGGLNLDGGVPVWSLDSDAMDKVKEYLRSNCD